MEQQERTPENRGLVIPNWLAATVAGSMITAAGVVVVSTIRAEERQQSIKADIDRIEHKVSMIDGHSVRIAVIESRIEQLDPEGMQRDNTRAKE